MAEAEPDEASPGEEPPSPMFGGRLLLRQARGGHRAGTDAVLLASAVRAEPGTLLIDVGAGAGTIGLMLTLREPGSRGCLIERDPAMAALARVNAALNGVDDRVDVVLGDVLLADTRRPLLGKAALVVTNPPFYLASETRSSPDAVRATAHVMGKAGHGGWLQAAAALLAPHGRLALIHRPEALPTLLAAAEGRLGGIVVRPIHAHVGEPAIRILLAGTRGSRAPFAMLDPLVLHGKDGRFTSEAARLHRGEGESMLLQTKKAGTGCRPPR